jgi:hypothetical protein
MENQNEIVNVDKVLTPAERHYVNHLKAVSKYTKTHTEKNRQKSRDFYERLRADPEKHKLFLESRRNVYKEKKLKKL